MLLTVKPASIAYILPGSNHPGWPRMCWLAAGPGDLGQGRMAGMRLGDDMFCLHQKALRYRGKEMWVSWGQRGKV